MKFHKIEDRQDLELYHLHYSENDKFAIWITPVMFGMRVRGGFVSDLQYFHSKDYCGGADQENMENLWSVFKGALENIDEDNLNNDNDLRHFPIEGQRPTKSPGSETFSALKQLAGEYEIEELPDCNKIRLTVLHNHFNF